MKLFSIMLLRMRLLLLVFLGISIWTISMYVTDSPAITLRGYLPAKWNLTHEAPTEHVTQNELQKIYKRRVVHLRKACKYLQPKSGPAKLDDVVLKHLLVDDVHKLLYCYVPKVACTNWKRILMVLTGKSNASDILSIPADAPHRQESLVHLNNFTEREIKRRLRTYRKFLFVRHPFERLLSAYRNKLEQNYNSSQYFQERFGRYIIKHYRANPSLVSLAKGNDVTFREFVEYLVDQRVDDYNEHWKPMADLCDVCSVQYDFVGKYESLERDAQFVLERMGVDSQLSFPKVQQTSNTRENMKKYFQSIPLGLLMKLYNIYSEDFRYFNYTLLDIL